MGPLETALEKIKGHRVYFDTSVLIYFFDKNPFFFSSIVPFIVACDRGEFSGITGDAAVCELMVHPYRSKNPAEVSRGKSFFNRKNFITVVRHGVEIFDTASQLRGVGSLKMMDALHYSTAIHSGCQFFITRDSDFQSTGMQSSVEVINLKDIVTAQ
jgi:predicted nucleic acid-binding protein